MANQKDLEKAPRKYFEGQHKSPKLCCYYPDTMRLYDERSKGRYYRIMYCRNHKKTFRLSINSDSYCLEDGVGSIENFEKVWQKEVKRFKHRPIGNVIRIIK